MHYSNSVPLPLLTSLLTAPSKHNVDLMKVLNNAGLAQLSPLINASSELIPLNQRINLNDFALLLRSLWQEMGDEASGFLSSPLKNGFFSMMCHSLITAKNLHHSLLRGARFLQLITEELSIELKQMGEEVHLIIHYKNPHQFDETFFVSSIFIIWIRLACWMINQPMLLERIHFQFPTPSYHREFSLMFPCPHYFSSPLNMVVFNKRFLSLPLQQDSESLSSFLYQAPESLLTQFRTDESLTAQIKRMLLHRQGMKTSLENMSFEAVSQALYMTTHTLRRRLKEEGNSFQEIKDSIRRNRAIVLLKNPKITLHDIASQLGFSEAAAFNRAFKKWMGITPGAYRDLQLN